MPELCLLLSVQTTPEEISDGTSEVPHVPGNRACWRRYVPDLPGQGNHARRRQLSWELKAFGHITVPRDAPPDAVAALEAELAGRIAVVLNEYQYGCSNISFTATTP